MKGKDLHPRLLYPAKLSFSTEGQIEHFPDKVKLKEFIITKPLLYEMLKGLISEIEDQKLWTVKLQQTQLSTTEPKKKQKLSKQLEQEQSQRNEHHMEGFQWGGGREE